MKQIIFVFLILITAGCDKTFLGDEDQLLTLEENLKPPPALNDGWEVSTLAAENIKTEPIHNLIQELQKEPRNIHSLLIFRNNKLVSESYFDGWNRGRLHTLRSATKSFNSTLIGIALDQNKLSNINQKVFDFFPEYSTLNNAQKQNMTIEHLLTMSSGFQWNQTTTDPKINDETGMEKSNNWIEYTLRKDIVTTPGTSFFYNSGCSNLLAGITKKSTGDHADVFAEKYLFAQLKIANYFWRKQKDGYCNAGYGLLLTPRDMSKLGQVFLDSGKWKGIQIVSSSWVIKATSTFFGNEENENGYAYQWWTAKYNINSKTVRVFSARGNGGQYIFVVPSLNAVITFTGGNFSPLDQGAPFGIMTNVILPAML
jgi:CubicO group peptidase (beta-lactamase class C family)